MLVPRSRWISLLLALASTGWGTAALATVTIPEALSQGQQMGANQEESAGSNINGLATTANGAAGVGSVQAVGNPADGADSRTGATATGTYSFTLNCNQTTSQNPIFPGDYGLFVANCTYSGSGSQSTVSGFTLGYCLASVNGGNCMPESPNWQYTGAGSGQSVQLASGITVSMGTCPANGSASCPGTLTVNNSTVHTADSGALTNDATNEVLSGQNGVQNAMEQTYNSGNYQSALQTGNSQYQLSSCTQQITGGLNGNGIIYTCNHAQQANFNPNACTSTEQCVKWATQTEDYTETCNQDIPLSENTCTTQTPVQNCTITEQQAQYTCYNTLNASVSAQNSCTPGQWYTVAQSTQCGVGGCGDVTFGTAGGECYQYSVQFYCNPGSTSVQYRATSAYWGQGASGTLYASWSGTLYNGEQTELNDPSMSSNNCDGGWDWYPDISVQTYIDPEGNVSGSIAFHAWTSPYGYSPLVSCANPQEEVPPLPNPLVCQYSSNCKQVSYSTLSYDKGTVGCSSLTRSGSYAYPTYTCDNPYWIQQPNARGGLYPDETVFCNVNGGSASACNYAGGNTISYNGNIYACTGGLGYTATGELTQTFGLNFIQQIKTVSESWDNGCSIYANAN